MRGASVWMALVLSLMAAQAQAQSLSPRDPTLQLAPPDPELYRAQRRQRLWLAAGIGLMASSLAHVAIISSAGVRSCNNKSHVSLTAAGVFGGIGFLFTLGGGMRLARTTPRYPATRGQKLGAAFTALGTALGAQAVLMTFWALQGVGACSS